MEGMEKQHEILKRRLPAILDIMADAEKQACRRGGVKAWLEKLKTVVYEANDVFDEFEYEALRRRAKKNGHITKLSMAGVKLFPTHNRVAFRSRMGNKLSSIVEAIKVLVEEMKDFGFDKFQLEAPAWNRWREMDSVIVDPENIVSRSRERERKKIIEVLLNHQACSGDLLVLPIVGMGGLGKTTLTQLIYNDPQVKEHFQLLKWVCVSDDFNVCNLANKVCNASETNLEEALNKLQEHLRGKRYLLVLDDVWNKDVDKWGKLKACLNQGGVGSAILTTTRDKEIAEFMGTVANNSSWKNKYHDVAILDIDFIHEIIETRAFGLQKTKPEELVKLVGPIAERCVGSPLAAKALGSVLCNKTTKEEWEDILHRSRICDHETGILPILKLSYNDLSTDMKQCFAFCAMYPKDYQIDVEELIQLWMTNGYISDQNKVSAETMGKRIVNEMVSRSFFQYEEQRRIGCSSTTFVKIHDLMHDVALSASEKECVCIIDEFIESAVSKDFLSK
ncbi:putative disease resistance protein RGA4 isoform X2 [Miscanthus floridulus]|uniref:putative disease resistance protein RGA4 isoform X2 n=1 Tax=Miscanthus floridulus TaxID=154761 RepID=UPI003458776F